MIEILKPYYRRIRRQVIIVVLVHAYIAQGDSFTDARNRVRADAEDLTNLEALLDKQ